MSYGEFVGIGYLFLLGRKLLFKRKSSVLTASLAVAATIFLITFTGVVFGGVFNAAERDLVNFQYANVVIRNEKEDLLDKTDYQIISQVYRHPLVEAAAPRLQAQALEVSHRTPNGTNSVYKVFMMGVDPLLEPEASLLLDQVVAGDSQIFKGTALIGKDLAEDLGFDDGKGSIEIEIKRGDEEISERLTVTGIIESSVLGGLNDLLIVHIDFLREVLDIEKSYSSYIILKLNQPEKSDEVIAWISSIYTDYEVLTAREVAGWLEQAEATTRFVNLVGYAGMIAAALAVITILTMMVSGKTRDIGILRSLGISKKGILVIFIFNGVLIGLIGSALGALASSSVVLLLQNFPITFFGGIVLEVEFDFESLISPIILGFIISVIASIYPAWRASKYEPAEAVKYV